MISSLRAALLGVYLSGCAITASSSVNTTRNSHGASMSFLSTYMVTGYAGSTTLNASVDQAFHGFKVGLRGESCVGANKHTYRASNEFSFRGLFGEEGNLYEFGMTNGVRVLGSTDDHSLEILAGPARMGISSDNGKYWTPQAGLGYNLWPFQLQTGADFRVGKEKGAGVFVNGGFLF